MRPKKIVISAWGPYKDRIEIDFTNLRARGLFLITGPTGAGKTTIFDALTYSLYGAMSGEQREKNSVRSDFAEGDTPTFVELFMEHGGKDYHILRNPEYFRPKKRQSFNKTYTREKENASVTLPDGSVIEGVGEVNRKMQEVLVLDYRQFKQISMIAQGEFARLLAASPAEKTKIFREIFSTAVYDRFSTGLRSRSGELYRQIMEYRHRIDEDIHMLEEYRQDETEIFSSMETSVIAAYLGECAAKWERLFKEEQKLYEQAEKELALFVQQCETVKRNNDLIDRREKAQRAFEELKTGENQIRTLHKELAAARAAASLEGDYVRWEQEERLFLEAGENLKTLEEEQEKTGREILTLEAVYEDRELIRDAYGYRKSKKEVERQIKAAGVLIGKQEEELDRLQKEYLREESSASAKKKAYDVADQVYKRAAVGIAARLLVDAQPCPVCGSLEHPRKAVITDEIPDEEGLRCLREEYERVNERLMLVHGSARACQGNLQEKKTQLLVFEQQEKECEKHLHQVPERVKAVLEKFSEEDFAECISRYEKLVVLRDEKKAAWTLLQKEYAKHRESKKKLLKLLEKRVREALFKSVLEFKESIRTGVQIREAEETIEIYKNKVQQAESLQAHLINETAGMGKTDTLALEEKILLRQSDKKTMLRKQAELSHKLQDYKKVQKSLKERDKKLKELETEYGVVKDLDNLAAGNNSRRLVFEQYVLAGYFEEILEAANIRLGKITGGRFELSRSEEVTDGRTKDNLEIRVLDYYTGKYRSVKTLSGGESFKASLSLALGMSDVIQAYSGGIKVDALFIDEGFGSLDMESLEQACETLLSLVEKDRMIGIISHVPELSEKIREKIIITKTNTGSSLKIIV